LSTPEQLSSASSAARALTEAAAKLLNADGLAKQAAQHAWIDQDTLIANLIGLLSQTHEATAGWIGNCIVALLSQPGVQGCLRADPQLTGAFVQEVARFDPPVQNTRRFVTQPVVIAGVQLQAGDVVLLLLGAAGHDEEANPQADIFSLERAQRKLPGFGHGRHACPGPDIACNIVTGAVLHLLELPEPMSARSLAWRYAPSTNGRLPQFFTPH
jgi:cytochrome P450